MKKWVIHSYTDYCGTDSYEVVEAETEDEAVNIGMTVSYDNATSCFEVVSDEEMMEIEELGVDTERFITDEQFGYDIEPFDENLHADLI